MRRHAETKIRFGRCLKIGIGLGMGGAVILVILETLFFLVSRKRLLLDSPAENGLLFLYSVGVILLYGVIIGVVEGIISWAVFKVSTTKTRFDFPALFLAVFYGLGLFIYEFTRNGVWNGLLDPAKSAIYLKFFILSTLVCLPIIFPLYYLQMRRHQLVRGERPEKREGSAFYIRSLILPGIALIFLYWVNAFFYPRQYPYIHNMFVVAIFWLGELFCLGLFSVIPRLRRFFLKKSVKIALTAVIISCLILTFFRMDHNQNVKRIVLMETPVLSKGVRWLQRIFDFDRDGYSMVLGGGDRAEGDPSINPGAYDIPGNGIDEDCSGGDRVPREYDTGKEAPESRRLNDRTNVIFITVDAVRADHLGCYGYRRDTTPNIDRLAAEGVRFASAYSQSSTTIYSLNSIMTSLIPLVVEKEALTPTLAEILKKAGFVTGVIGPKIHFEVYDYRHVFYRGFDFQHLKLPPSTTINNLITSQLTRQAISFARAHKDEPFFLWLHYYDPHAPYITNPETSDWGNNLMDIYDGELRRADFWLGNFLQGLKALGLYKRSILVIFGDHGEEFREHGSLTHSTALYNETIQPPLIIKVPGIEPRAVLTRVGLIDIAPTILDILDLPQIPGRQGRSLLPLMTEEGSSLTHKDIYSEILRYRKKAIIHGDWKLIHDYRYNTFELYNLKNDPGEKRNLFDREPKQAIMMKELLASFY